MTVELLAMTAAISITRTGVTTSDSVNKRTPGRPRNRLRLAFFYRDYLHGGAYPRDTRLLAEALAERVERVYVYCYTKNLEEAGERTENGVTTVVEYVPARYWTRNVVSVPHGLRRRLASNQDSVDLVTLIAAFVPENYPIARLLRRSGIPYAVSPGEPINAFARHVRGIKRIRKRLYLSVYERTILEHAAAIQVCSEAHHVHLRQLGIRVDPSAVFVGREAIDWQAVREERGDVANVSQPAAVTAALQEPPVFGYLGRLRVFHKGLDLLIEAWSIYRALGGEGRLLFVGPGSDRDREKLASLCAHHGVPDVEILPPKYGRDKFEYLASLSGLVHPSRHDGITRVIREGIAAGCVLITTYNTHIYELLERYDAGFVTTLDPYQVALAMRALASQSPEARLRMRVNVERVAEELNWDAGAEQFLVGIEGTVLRDRALEPSSRTS